MTPALLSRLAAAAIINLPLAWLVMNNANHRVAAAIAAGHLPTLRVHGYGFWFAGLLLVGLLYVVVVEAVSFLLRGDWRAARSSAADTGRLTSA